MGKINKEWHLANKMPNPPAGGPTEDDRFRWHLEHEKNCDCREIPESLRDKINKWQNKK